MSRSPSFAADGIDIADSADAALERAGHVEEVMIIGGAEIYAAFLPLAQRIYLTVVEGEFEGDAYFPDYEADEWAEIESTHHDADERNPHPHRFVILERE